MIKRTNNQNDLGSIDLNQTDGLVAEYLRQFPTFEEREARALTALGVGVIAINSASPTLDTTIVDSKFKEIEKRIQDSVTEFQQGIKDELRGYFKEGDGSVPRSLDLIFGENGRLGRQFEAFFSPEKGKLSQELQRQIGPESVFGRVLDPKNKDGIICQIEDKVQSLVEEKLKEILEQFSLDSEDSAMNRLNNLLTESFSKINETLNIAAAVSDEANKGHVKGIEFENDLYTEFAKMGMQLGDATEFTRGAYGTLRKKTGDFVAELGDSSGYPGARIAVEVKNSPYKLKDAIDELQVAKENRAATAGIFVFAKGTEPPELGDFRKIGEDYYVTVDKERLELGQQLIFLDAAYQIARAFMVTSHRKEKASETDNVKILEQIQSINTWVDKLSGMSTKARTIQKNGEMLNKFLDEFKEELCSRLLEITNSLAA